MSDTFPRYTGTDAIPDWQLHADLGDDAHRIEHDWTNEGWGPFTSVLITPHDPTTYSDTIVTGRGRITGVGASGNRREWRLRRGTNWADSEIRSLWWGGSVWDNAISLPQMGHVHRAQEVSPGVWRAWVVTNNIFLSNQNTINQNIWQSDGTTITLGSNGGSRAFSLERLLRTYAVERLNFGGWLNRYTYEPRHGYGVTVGDLITTTSLDATFTETGRPVVSIDPAAGNLTMTETTTLSTVAVKLDTGSVYVTGAKRYWPYWVASRLVGNVLTVKAWRHQDDEPDWGDSSALKIFDATVTSPGDGQGGIPSPNIPAVTSGRGLCGLVAAHLRNNAYMEYGRTVFTRLT